MDQPTARTADKNLVVSPSRNWWPLTLSFAAIILAVHLFPYLKISKPTIAENRVLSTAPRFPTSLDDWSSIPSKLDSFVIDQFPVRTYLISGINYLRYKLGYSGSNKVIVGKDGWLFYDDGGYLALAAGHQKLEKEGIDNWVQGLSQRIRYSQRNGAKFYFLLGPIKEDIYPEYRPAWMPSERVRTEVDDIIAAAQAAGYDQVIDPRPAILDQKSQQKLYDEYDTHWTGLGAYIGYEALMSRIAKDLPSLAPLPITAFQPVHGGIGGVPRNLSLMLGIDDFVAHDRVTFATAITHDPKKTTFLSNDHSWVAPQVLHTDANTGKTLLLLRDSFASELLPMLKEQFETIITAHVQDGFFRKDLVEQFKPDVIVVEVIESGIRHSMREMPELELKAD
ncbi:MAG: alginate O-acetyltransferase AlgX-related protein [Janthinobacterium lividum]|jgi:alginate O-acetyltransferase complex protein AlgJ